MTDIAQLPGKDADNLSQHRCMTIPSNQPHFPGRSCVGRMMIDNNYPPAVLRNMQTLYNARCPAGTGHPSTLSADQGAEHSVGVSSAASPLYFDPKSIVELAVEVGCNCVASTYGVLASVLWRHAHRIPFLVKLNHNETLNYPNVYGRTLYTSVEQVSNTDVVAVGMTIYSGSEESRHQVGEISATFEHAHELGMVTIPRAHLRDPTFEKDGVDYHVSANPTGQANHLAVTIGVDTVKQKIAEDNGSYKTTNYGYTDDHVYNRLTDEDSIDLVRYQLANYYTGRIGLISSDGTAGGETDLSDIARTAAINRRTGGMGPTLGRKAFRKSMADGVKLISVVQDVYLDSRIIIA